MQIILGALLNRIIIILVPAKYINRILALLISLSLWVNGIILKDFNR